MIPSAPVTTAPVTIGLAVLLGLLMHWWPRMSAEWRWRLSILTNAAGLAALVAATQAEGSREAATTAVLLLGASHTLTASASASLYYYVLTALCLALGFAGLAFGESLSGFLRRRFLLGSALVAWLVTASRFLLEKSAAPVVLSQAVGVTLFAPIAGAYLGACARDAGLAARELLRVLVAYAFLVRGAVAVVGLAATRLGTGTHYDVSGMTSVTLAGTGRAFTFVPGSWTQAIWLTLVPQLTLWTVYTVAVGFAAGWLVLRRSRRDERGRGRDGGPGLAAPG
jgi:hypothetical protein